MTQTDRVATGSAAAAEEGDHQTHAAPLPLHCSVLFRVVPCRSVSVQRRLSASASASQRLFGRSRGCGPGRGRGLLMQTRTGRFEEGAGSRSDVLLLTRILPVSPHYSCSDSCQSVPVRLTAASRLTGCRLFIVHIISRFHQNCVSCPTKGLVQLSLS